MNPDCNGRTARWRNCLARLADGWILPSDLCPECTNAFVIALDSIDEPLVWHEAYARRAAQ